MSIFTIILAMGLTVFYVSGPGKEAVLAKAPKFVVKTAVKLRNDISDLKYIFKKFPSADLPSYQLFIDKENLAKLDESIPDLDKRAQDPNYLPSINDLLLEENKVYVPGKFVADGREYDVEVRYRGGGFPHWSEAKKSLRLKFSKNNLFESQSQINLIIPLERGYIAEEFNNFRAKRLGLIVPKSKFVTISLNGDKPALYWEVEHFTKEFVETGEWSGDANLYAEGDFWQQQIYTDLGYWKKFLTDPTQASKNNYSEFNRFLNTLNNSSDEFFNENIFNIIDKENFYAWNIHSILAGSTHQDYAHNFRVYFDKSVGKLKIIPWDLMLYNNAKTTLGNSEGIEANMNPLAQRIFINQQFLQERNDRLWLYLKDPNNLQEELSYFDELYLTVQKAFYDDPVRNRSYGFFEKFVLGTRTALENNFNRFRLLFIEGEASYLLENSLNNDNLNLIIAHSDSLAPVYLFEFYIEFAKDQELIPFEVYADGRKICEYTENSLDLKKNRVKVKCNKHNLNPLVTSFNVNEDNPVVYYAYRIYRARKKQDALTIVSKQKIDFQSILKIKAKIKNSYTDNTLDEVEGYIVDNTEFANFEDISKTPQEFVSSNPRFYLNFAKEIVLPSGLYIFSENIVIPRNTKLIILPGAQINLTNDASFISYSPVSAIGTATNKIYIRGESDGLGENFGVLDNKGLSKFEYVEFSGGGESTVNGAFFSGMLAIHHADSIVKHSIFRDAQGDDALNIKYASSTISYNLFADNSADAIDYDFSGGTIEHNKFIDNGNDGIDTSGSDVLIQYNYIATSGDKCMSIGEKSTSVIFNNVLNNCLIGIEVKDLSTPIIINNVIVNNDIGINEYQKKPIFGGGMGKVYNTIIWDNKESVTLDDVSRIEIINSSVEGDYDGEGNFAQKPIFNEDFTNNRENANIKFQNGGNREIIKEFLGLNLLEVPVGLVKEFASGL